MQGQSETFTERGPSDEGQKSLQEGGGKHTFI